MAYIDYVPWDAIPEDDRVDDTDNILRIHGIHSRVMPRHFALYRELMYGAGPLTRIRRESIAVRVSALNECHY